MNIIRRNAGLLLSDPAYFFKMAAAKGRAFLPIDYYLNRNGRAFPPIHLTLEVTHRCNLSCHMCDLYGGRAEIDSIRSRRDGSSFSLELLEKLCDSFHLVKPVLSFGGGEPLLHPEIVEMVALAKGRGFNCTLTTNGTLLEERAAGLVGAGLHSLVLSIDGPEDIHDSIRGVSGTFAKARAGARKLREIQKAGRYSKPLLRINCTINSRNSGALSRMVDIAEDFGAESLVFSHLWFWDRAIVERHNREFGEFCPVVEQNTHELDLIKPEIVSREIEKVKGRRTKMIVKFLPELSAVEIKSYYTDSQTPVKRSACRAPWLTAFIMPDGEVIPCLDYSYGNLKEESFAGIWNGERARRFRRQLRRKSIFPACVRCCLLYAF